MRNGIINAYCKSNSVLKLLQNVLQFFLRVECLEIQEYRKNKAFVACGDSIA